MTDDKLIYLDNAATTSLSEGVFQAVQNAMRRDYYNISALYKQSVTLTGELREARELIRHALHGTDGEIYFTSGGTESNNTVLFGVRKKKGSRIIIGQGEHDSVYNTAQELKNQGYDVQFAPINSDGAVDVERYKELLDESVSLISIMHVSNETGAINDIARLRRLAKKLAPNAIFHSDGVQAFLKTDINLKAMDIDLYTVSAHKIHGPKGIGALYVKKGVSIKPLLYGGGQEKGFRSGTESYPLISGFGQAVREGIQSANINDMPNAQADAERIAGYRKELLTALNERIHEIKVITPLENSVPHILTVAFADVRGEVLLHSLEDYGVLVGTGSACASHHESRFKKLFNLDARHIDGVIRFSMSADNDVSEIAYVADSVKKCYDKLNIR